MTDLRSQLQTTLGAAYTVERELGGGGMSRVFVAEETAFGRRVVLKLLAPELVAGVNVDRFKREIQLAAKLQHPHIVPVITAGESAGLPYYTMPFVEGESLRARLARVGRLGIGETVGLLRDVAKALAYAHERGIVHRDIKPDNVLLAGGSATVADFGIAKALAAARGQRPERAESARDPFGSALTAMGTSIGTPLYMAPEQAAGDPDVDHRADIYSFACMAYEMLAGQPPFVAKTPQRLLAAHMSEKPRDIREHRTDVPAELADLIMRCLEKEPSARPQSVSDMLPLLDATTSGGDRPAAPALLLDPRGMLRKALIGYLVAVVAVAILARAAIIALGLPDWVFPGSMLVMALGLPAILFTGYAQHVARKTFTATPTYTPGGSSSIQHGTMATIALKASPHLSWKRTMRWGVYAVAGFVVLVAAATAMRYAGIGPFATLLSAGTLKEGARVVVADFALPDTTDASLGRVIADAVKAALGQSTAVNVVPESDVGETLRQMRRADARLVLPVAREVAQRRGARAVVDGSLSPIGSGFMVTLRLVTADSGRELASVTGAADSPSQLIEVVGRLTKKLRGKLGESLKSVRSSPTLADVTTTSLEALRKYSEGRYALYMQGNRPKFVRLMREAIALDSEFVMAYGNLGVELSARGGEDEEVVRLATKAYQLRERLPQRERLNAELFYYRSGPVATRSYASQVAILDTLLAIASASTGTGSIQSAALLARAVGDTARADSLFRLSVKRDSLNSYGIGNLTFFLLVRGRRPAAESAFAIYNRQFPRTAYPYRAAFLVDSGKAEAAERTLKAEYDSARADPFQREAIAGLIATVASHRGALREAAIWRERNAAARVERGLKGPALIQAAADAQSRVMAVHDTAGAVSLLDAALARTPISSIPTLDQPNYELARAYAAAGRPDRAKPFLAGLERQENETDPNVAYLIHTTRAEIAMAERRWDDAIRILRGTLPGRCANCVDRARALAFDGAQQADSAIHWYERSLVAITSFGVGRVVSYRRLGELYEGKGNVAKALANYQKFVDAWKGADAELQPQVADVRSRIARLQRQEAGGR